MNEPGFLNPPVTRALLVEDLHPVREGLKQVLELAFSGVVVDAVACLSQARQRLARSGNYQLALVDLGLPDGSGLDLLAELRASHPNTMSVVMTIYDDDEHLFTALSVGAQGYLLKDQPANVLVSQLTALRAGTPALAPTVTRRILQHLRHSHSARVLTAEARLPLPVAGPSSGSEPNLTPRETEVLSLIGRGLQRGEVAHVLGRSENTVAKFIKDIYRKLNISSRAEAALEASRRGLV